MERRPPDDLAKEPPLLAVYLEQRAALKRFLAARLGSDDDAEDLLQDLFFRIERLSAAEQIENEVGYLYKIALNLAHDHRRRNSRSQSRDGQWVDANQVTVGAEAVVDRPGADDAYDAKQRLAAVAAAIEELSPHCRRVFTLHKFDGLTHAEVAAQLGISRSTVEKHMNTALKHLMKLRERD